MLTMVKAAVSKILRFSRPSNDVDVVRAACQLKREKFGGATRKITLQSRPEDKSYTSWCAR